MEVSDTPFVNGDSLQSEKAFEKSSGFLPVPEGNAGPSVCMVTTSSALVPSH